MGLAAALLVFTGIWHMTEFLMDHVSKDTRRLIPAGVVYLLLGILIALGIATSIIGVVALIAVLAGGIMAFRKRKATDVRRWVIWAFIVIDAIIALAIVNAWL
jgi:hypothetical protein